jgi:hypothetical protein
LVKKQKHKTQVETKNLKKLPKRIERYLQYLKDVYKSERKLTGGCIKFNQIYQNNLWSTSLMLKINNGFLVQYKTVSIVNLHLHACF